MDDPQPMSSDAARSFALAIIRISRDPKIVAMKSAGELRALRRAARLLLDALDATPNEVSDVLLGIPSTRELSESESDMLSRWVEFHRAKRAAR